MPIGYDIFLSSGPLLTTVNPETIDDQESSSLILIGAGSKGDWQASDQNFAWMLENFSAPTPPINPLIGQMWHDRFHNRMNFFGGSAWTALISQRTTLDGAFDMLDTASGVDFTTAGTIPVFTAPDLTQTYIPTLLMLIPLEPITATSMPMIEVSAETPGDILSSMSLMLSGNSDFAQLPANECARIINKVNQTAFINITTPASGGSFVCDVYLFGFVTPYVAPPPTLVGLTETGDLGDSADATVVRYVPPGSYGYGLYGDGLYQPEQAGVVAETGDAQDAVDAVVIPFIPPSGSYGAGLYGEGTYQVDQAGVLSEAGAAEDAVTVKVVYAVEVAEAGSATDIPNVSLGYGESDYGVGEYGE
jgi:hypothetical protein